MPGCEFRGKRKKKKSRRTPSQRPRPSSFGARQSGVWSELPGLRNRIAPAPPTSGERPWKCLRRLAAQDLADGEQPVLSLILFLFNFPCFVTHCVNAARLPGVSCGVNWSLSHFEMIRTSSDLQCTPPSFFFSSPYLKAVWKFPM